MTYDDIWWHQVYQRIYQQIGYQYTFTDSWWFPDGFLMVSWWFPESCPGGYQYTLDNGLVVSWMEIWKRRCTDEVLNTHDEKLQALLTWELPKTRLAITTPVWFLSSGPNPAWNLNVRLAVTVCADWIGKAWIRIVVATWQHRAFVKRWWNHSLSDDI